MSPDELEGGAVLGGSTLWKPTSARKGQVGHTAQLLLASSCQEVGSTSACFLLQW